MVKMGKSAPFVHRRFERDCIKDTKVSRFG